MAGEPVPEEGGGLGQARTAGSEGASGTKAPACVEKTVATEERFWDSSSSVTSERASGQKFFKFGDWERIRTLGASACSGSG